MRRLAAPSKHVAYAVTPASGSQFPEGHEIAVEAIPDDGYEFVQWNGDLAGSAALTSLKMDGDKHVIAVFDYVATRHTVATTVTSGSGTIVADPPPNPDGRYPAGTRVTFLAQPNDGYSFTGWGGDLAGMPNPATITVGGEMEISASFYWAGGMSIQYYGMYLTFACPGSATPLEYVSISPRPLGSDMSYISGGQRYLMCYGLEPQTVTLSITEAGKGHFLAWSGSGYTQTGDTTVTFTTALVPAGASAGGTKSDPPNIGMDMGGIPLFLGVKGCGDLSVKVSGATASSKLGWRAIEPSDPPKQIELLAKPLGGAEFQEWGVSHTLFLSGFWLPGTINPYAFEMTTPTMVIAFFSGVDISAYATSDGCFKTYAERCTPKHLFPSATGKEFLDGLVKATQDYGSIANFYVYSHCGLFPSPHITTHNGGFWGSYSHNGDGNYDNSGFYATAVQGDYQDARYLADLQALINEGKIKFAPGKLLFLEGCHCGEIGTFAANLGAMTQRLCAASWGGSTDVSRVGGPLIFRSKPRVWEETVDPDYDGWIYGSEQKGTYIRVPSSEYPSSTFAFSDDLSSLDN